MPWMIDPFGLERCQKKRKYVDYKLFSNKFLTVGCQKFVQYIRILYPWLPLTVYFDGICKWKTTRISEKAFFIRFPEKQICKIFRKARNEKWVKEIDRVLPLIAITIGSQCMLSLGTLPLLAKFTNCHWKRNPFFRVIQTLWNKSLDT